MHQAQWSPERPLPPPVSLASQSHHEKPPEVTCTSRGNPGFPASTRERDRKSTRLNSSHQLISYAVFCLKKKKRWKSERNSRRCSGVPHLFFVDLPRPNVGP